MLPYLFAGIEAVKLLPTLNLDQELGIKLIIKEIPVTYEYVQTHVPQLWATLKPKVSSFFSVIFFLYTQ